MISRRRKQAEGTSEIENRKTMALPLPECGDAAVLSVALEEAESQVRKVLRRSESFPSQAAGERRAGV